MEREKRQQIRNKNDKKKYIWVATKKTNKSLTSLLAKRANKINKNNNDNNKKKKEKKQCYYSIHINELLDYRIAHIQKHSENNNNLPKCGKRRSGNYDRPKHEWAKLQQHDTQQIIQRLNKTIHWKWESEKKNNNQPRKFRTKTTATSPYVEKSRHCRFYLF